MNAVVTPVSPAAPGRRFPRVPVTVMLDEADGAPELVQWMARGRGRDLPQYRVHVAARGVIRGAEHERVTACGRPVPDHAVRIRAGRLDSGFCGQCMAALVLPHVPLPVAADWVRVAERAAAGDRA